MSAVLGGTKRCSSRYTAPRQPSQYPLCGLCSHPLVLAFGLVLRGFRLAKSIQEAAKAAKPERESCLVRAGRIAAHYWDDPARYAAQDKFGKGVLPSRKPE